MISRKKLELSIVYRSNAYLLNELLQDCLFFCEDREVLSQTRYTQQLKKQIDDRVQDATEFYRTGKHVITYSQNVNLCQYPISSLKDFGLRADDITKYFDDSTNRFILWCFKDSPKFSYSPPELTSELIKGPMCILFDTIFMTLHDRMRKNEFRFAFANSSSLACRI